MIAVYITSQTDVFLEDKSCNEGDEITVMMNPNDPQDIIIPGRSVVGGTTVFDIILIVAGIAVFILTL